MFDHTNSTLDKKVEYKPKDKLRYERVSGKVITISIMSELRSHVSCPEGGYEALFYDNSRIETADARRIRGPAT